MGYVPVAARADLGVDLKCRFDVQFDMRASEQAWAIKQGLAEIPDAALLDRAGEE